MLLLTAATSILAIAAPAPDAIAEMKLPLEIEVSVTEGTCNDAECMIDLNEIVLNDEVLEEIKAKTQE